ncbi:hypothetical protein RHSIM_Rhsim01G0028800 [Rhododendron simsii]|uniref:Peptidase C1A papain C-terminal domain-containing protein n=1 Tax=Rhododendron simsii TaxID=118357 RepID=A0A834HF97_RHOSS|nr:hypothetical protein RHSIM_Rhsim01G0028800 [Rhododendron simsii]
MADDDKFGPQNTNEHKPALTPPPDESPLSPPSLHTSLSEKLPSGDQKSPFSRSTPNPPAATDIPALTPPPDESPFSPPSLHIDDDEGGYLGSGLEGMDLDFSRLNIDKGKAKMDEDMVLNFSRLNIDKGKVKMDEVKANKPKSFDWRRVWGDLNPVVHQQEDICWALVVSEATSVGYSIHTGRETLLKLAGQELIDNIYPDSMVNYPCNLSDPFEYIRLNGLSRETPDIFPYSGEKNPSREKTKLEESSSVKIMGTIKVDPNDEEALEWAVLQCPVACGMIITEDFVDLEKDIYRATGRVAPDPMGSGLRHAILLVGYDTTEEGEKYWIFKNTWGTNWGDKGYGKMARGKSLIFNAEYPYFRKC